MEKGYLSKRDLKTYLSKENNDNAPIIVFLDIIIKISIFIFLNIMGKN